LPETESVDYAIGRGAMMASSIYLNQGNGELKDLHAGIPLPEESCSSEVEKLSDKAHQRVGLLVLSVAAGFDTSDSNRHDSSGGAR
jgi:hypothetical protein